MRITTKLTLALTLTSGLILGAYAWWEFRQEEIDLRAATEHDLKLLGTAVQISVENALRDGQPADIREVLESLELKDSTIDVFVFDAHDRLIANSLGSTQTLPLLSGIVSEVAATGRPIARFEGPHGLSHLIAVEPLTADDGSNLGLVALVRPLHEMRRDLLAMAESRLLTILTLFAGLAVIGWWLITQLVQRPLDRLVLAMGAVRDGDLFTHLPSEGGNELARVVTEFNAMVNELNRARQRIVAEAESRQLLEAGLQRVDKLVTVGQLSAGLAHEIGSPLQILNGRARALAGRLDVAADVRRTAQILVEQSDRIASIVEQLLNFARKRSARVEAANLEVPVRAIFDLLSPDAQRKGLTVELTCGPQLPRILADSQQIQQVALNLLTNAFRATPSGGWVRVGVFESSFERGDGAVQLSVCVTVEDSGAGIEPQTLNQIFEPFFTTWEKAGGAGLGLAVVKSIVTEHEGVVSVTSVPGKGTLFSAHFPQRVGGQRAAGKVA